MNEFFGALLAAAVAAFVSYFISNRDLSDSLDTKSGWRAKLFDVASKYELTLDDAQTVRAALRIFPQSEKVEQYSFTWLSNIMIVQLDKYILNEDYRSKILKEKDDKANKKIIYTINDTSLMTIEEICDLNSSILNAETTDIVRLFAMFLLKYHFDYRSSMGAKDYLFMANKDKNKRYNSLVEETYVQYKKLMEK